VVGDQAHRAKARKPLTSKILRVRLASGSYTTTSNRQGISSENRVAGAYWYLPVETMNQASKGYPRLMRVVRLSLPCHAITKPYVVGKM
jgi:hypothetical protein